MMLKMLTACTAEVDDVDAAIGEILKQLDLDNALLKNSAGVLTCYREYIDTGAVEELCGRLPFDVMGCTTLSSSTGGRYGEELLSLAVLTGDDVSFSVVHTDPLDSKDQDVIKNLLWKAYGQARMGLDPALVVAVLPVLTDVGACQMSGSLDEICGGVPTYGLVSSDQTLSYKESRTICNGKSHPAWASLLLIGGNVRPKFYVTSIPERNIQRQKAFVTDSEDCLLKKVNGLPLLAYLAGLGLASENGPPSVSSVPFLVDYGEGAKPVAISMYKITPEGYAVCGGRIPVGATLDIGSIDAGGIIETAKNTLSAALNQDEPINGIFMFPCVTRSYMLSPNSMDEIEKVAEVLGGKVPYLFSYAGGEVCPVYGEGGKIFNRFHNYTCTACVF
jgi:hypothetical protein